MTLPFKKDDGKRAWQCFVCGLEYSSFEEFKQHILEDHEKGREYIVCPLARCGAPVRDLKSHFKAIHPKEPLPTGNIMYRSIVWKDHGPKKKGKKKTTFREGSIISNKMNGKEMHYRSGWECEVYECLESLPQVSAYWAEPIRIPYLHDGKTHDYLPDIRVQFTDGAVEIWEIKPSSQTGLEMNQNKWRAAEEYCKIRDWNFCVMTEIQINKLKKKVMEQRSR